MSRNDQYIGLTDEGQKFLDQKASLPGAKKEHIVLCEGAWIPEICGTKVTVPLQDDPTNSAEVYEEVIQAEPWSSGPMYFTCIKYTLIKKCGQILNMAKLFCWVENPEMQDQEYDSEKGHFWV